jgi:ABC-type lipoprotein release transport system permease subunit
MSLLRSLSDGLRPLFVRPDLQYGALDRVVSPPFGASRIMSSLLYRVSINDFAADLAVSATLTAVAALANYIPGRRAMRVDPLVTLRCEW